MTDSVKANCPACLQSYNVRVDKLGREIACRKCGATFTLTAATASAKIGAGAA